jgi:hypothetical protein
VPGIVNFLYVKAVDNIYLVAFFLYSRSLCQSSSLMFTHFLSSFTFFLTYDHSHNFSPICSSLAWICWGESHFSLKRPFANLAPHLTTPHLA